MLFNLLYSANMLCLLLFYLGLTRSSPVYSQDFYLSLPRDQSRNATPRLGVSVILKCTS